jgi:condensin-2 complex subunit H2
MAEHENRFAHLLAPIRDLSANWHTDIAAELSDYLAQLEDITFSFDGGNTSLNFAEGARRGVAAARVAGPVRAQP